jgi:spore coat polysaccharide biosynthesis protein SpsF
VACFRGHPTDLLDRHFRAGLAHGADAVVKIPSDCPVIDPDVIFRVLATYAQEPSSWDLVTNLQPPTYPDGNDVEIMPMAALERAFSLAQILAYLEQHPRVYALNARHRGHSWHVHAQSSFRVPRGEIQA